MKPTETSEVTFLHVIYSTNSLFLFNTSFSVLCKAHRNTKLLTFPLTAGGSQILWAFLFLYTRNERTQLLVSMFLFQEYALLGMSVYILRFNDQMNVCWQKFNRSVAIPCIYRSSFAKHLKALYEYSWHEPFNCILKEVSGLFCREGNCSTEKKIIKTFPGSMFKTINKSSNS